MRILINLKIFFTVLYRVSPSFDIDINVENFSIMAQQVPTSIDSERTHWREIRVSQVVDEIQSIQ